MLPAGVCTEPLPTASTALTVSIKAQQPVDKLARPLRALCRVGALALLRVGARGAAQTTHWPAGGAGGAGGEAWLITSTHHLWFGRTVFCTCPTNSA